MTSENCVIETAAGPAALRRTTRKTLAISVLPDGSLELVAPTDATAENILSKVEKRRKWILTQRRKFADMNTHRPQPRYVSGATHRYLGRQYRLKIRHGSGTSVVLKGGFFVITVSESGPEAVRRALARWFRSKAAEHFTRRISTWETWCAKHKLPSPRMRLLKMPKRWGSAGHDGRIALNPELIHMPSRCIDYVITHEICHLRHPNHGPQFQRLLSSMMPDWRDVKARLEQTHY